MTVHIVRQGECLSRIARRYGFKDAATLYEHADNAELRKKRPNPDVLHPGDRVAIPPFTAKQVSVATGKVHRFVVSLPKRRLRLVFVAGDGEALANEPFVLNYPGHEVEGKLDGKGLLSQALPVEVEQIEVTLQGTVHTVLIGHLNPLRGTADGGVSGMQARLANLGFSPGAVDGVLGPRTKQALRDFQAANGLSETEALDEPTAEALEREHGC